MNDPLDHFVMTCPDIISVANDRTPWTNPRKALLAAGRIAKRTTDVDLSAAAVLYRAVRRKRTPSLPGYVDEIRAACAAAVCRVAGLPACSDCGRYIDRDGVHVCPAPAFLELLRGLPDPLPDQNTAQALKALMVQVCTPLVYAPVPNGGKRSIAIDLCWLITKDAQPMTFASYQRHGITAAIKTLLGT